MPGSRVVIYVRPDGAMPEQQQVACLMYCERHGLAAQSICHRERDALQLLRTESVDLVVTAYAERDDDEFEDHIRRAGGRLEYVRRPRRSISAEIARVVAGMFRRGHDVPTIARMLDEQTGEIRGALRRMGLRPPPKQE